MSEINLAGTLPLYARELISKLREDRCDVGFQYFINKHTPLKAGHGNRFLNGSVFLDFVLCSYHLLGQFTI